MRSRDIQASPLAVAVSGYLPLALSLITAPITARALGPSGRGLFALVVVINEVGAAIFRWGLPEAVAYHMKTGANYLELRKHVRAFAAYTTPLACVLGAIVVSIPALRSGGVSVCVIAFVMTAWSPFIDTTTGCIRSSLMADGDLVALRNAPLLGAMPVALAIPTSYLLGVLRVEVVLCSLALGAVIQRIYLGRRAQLRLGVHGHHSRVTLGGLLKFGTRCVPAALSNLGNSRLDQLIIVPLVGVPALGVYSVAITVGMLPVSFGLGLALAAFNSIPSDVHGVAPRTLGRAVRLAIPPLVLITVVLAFVAPFAIPRVFGEEFRGSVEPCLLLLPGALAMSVNFSAWQTSDALGRPGISSVAQALSLLVTVVLLVLLLPAAGIAGAAIATSVAYIVRLMLSLYLLRRVGVTGFMPNRRDVADSASVLLGRT